MSDHDKLCDLLARHFPTVLKEDRAAIADDLGMSFDIAQALQEVERSQTSTKSDITAMKKALKGLEDAEAEIQSLGSFGSAFLIETAHQLNAFENDAFAGWQHTGHDSKEIITNKIREVRCGLSRSVREAEEETPPVYKSRKGAPRKTTALIFTRALYDVFEDLSGTKPTIVTDRETEEKQGPFLDFVRDMFTLFNVGATPEYMARAVCWEKNAKIG
ncbi:hypothetical protein [Thalassovita sp.]|uniref:hypothetical protein n=1 Tax=Thalassovita sp. TaxID=1979401 RepID=UPI0029DE5129|nr:hypothetical protein [Thalassovita sp.]